MQSLSQPAFLPLQPLQQLQQHKWGRLLMRLLKLTQINQLYSRNATLEGNEFISNLLQQLSITYTFEAEELRNIPATGGFIAVANHPYGALDGLLLLELLSQRREDTKVLANEVLASIPNLSSLILPVNPFDGKARKNISGMRQALLHLQEGHPLGVFPAGEVSNWQMSTQQVVDKPWQASVAKLIRKADVPVLPVHFSGHNSLTFLLMGMVHPLLQTARLPAELLNKQGHQVQVRIGKPIPAGDWQQYQKTELLSFIRAKTYALSLPSQTLAQKGTKAAPVVPETAPALLEEELANLPPSKKLYSHLHFDVYLARAGQIPHTLREIGRLREITFRQVGEGTRLAIDLDQYDHHYHHLFVYDRHARQLVGAYRVGKGKEIWKRHGKSGFYLNSLFKIKKELVPLLKHSLELGRSFIRPEYQRKALPLLLLWKGLSLFLKEKPNYKYLIGPVSISSCFSQLSQSLMVQFIKNHFYDPELAKYVKPRKAFRANVKQATHQQVLQQRLSGLSDLDNLIKEIEPRRQGLPVLLKRYLLQNARIIGFNIDPAFSNSLDGFMVMNVEDLPSETERLFHRIVS
ncbi:lysophospholipid acyltransferase family protein [Rufibacter quisquiliarum]|uniref:Putative hemolysin n=1 Tax=Rufibacter quisquiliarum TaxID=1549639 RepID=A0A839GW05_9BACT|nr:lysophospholipid acyltransferase family protein [Rufibacter quisquiliarum]MBA9078608.1 putative hemolysin [Rufibacter quisquiliarum]